MVPIVMVDLQGNMKGPDVRLLHAKPQVKRIYLDNQIRQR